MIEVISLIVSFFSSVIGAITGIGGGIIIKPVLDATRTMEISTVSFLSGVTVLSMTMVSLLRSRHAEFKLDVKISTLLALGGAIGGIIGKGIFDWLDHLLNDNNVMGLIHASVLLGLLLTVVLYVVFRKHIQTFHVRSIGICLLTGALLGLVSAFLGIGGGPFNVVVLYWIFSMDVKTAAKNSLFVIGFSQLFSLITTFVAQSVPSYNPMILLLMVVGGISGGIVGTSFLKRICMKNVQRVFVITLVFMIGVNLYNLICFL